MKLLNNDYYSQMKLHPMISMLNQLLSNSY